MKFEPAKGTGWAIYADGTLYVGGFPKDIDTARRWHKSYGEAIAEYDRQVEVNKPKPGEFEVGDRIEYHGLPGTHTGRVVKIKNGKRGVLFDEGEYENVVIPENEGWIPELYVKIAD